MIIAGAACDKCGKIIYWPHQGKVRIEKCARDEGWCAGKQTLCQECRKSVRREVKNNEQI
jgi:hypothetical protein